MTVPLIILAAGAVVAGFVGIPAALYGNIALEHFLEPSFTARASQAGSPDAPHGAAPATPAQPAAGAHALPTGAHAPAGAAAPAPAHGEGEVAHLSTAGELGLMVLSVGIAAVGIGLAWRIYVLRPEISEALAARFAGPHRVLTNKYYVDELYGATAVRGTMGAAYASWQFDRWVVDGIVNASGWITRATAWLSGLLDKHGVDGMVNATGSTLWEASFGYRRMQTGLIQSYALLMIVGVVTLVGVYLFLR
jgi:NADH:ubiquinone oxidoreductase subunit 5 (subunit L)/multisubunit Na+/H+ antiporter MnhA subunit